MKKYALFGAPGSGKSTFASELGKALGIPVYHLDVYRYGKEKKKTNQQEFVDILTTIINKEAWIAEGGSSSTMEMRYSKADVVIYFDIPRLICFWNIFIRIFNYHKDFSRFRGTSWRILQYTWNFDSEKRVKIEALRQKYPQVKFIIFKGKKDEEAFLNHNSLQ